MPEIIEVDRARHNLDEAWVGKKITKLEQLGPLAIDKFIDNVSLEEFKKRVLNYTVRSIHRIAKNLVIVMSSGYMWRTHFSSTGWLKDITESTKTGDYHLHNTQPPSYRIEIGVGEETWVYSDARTWGRFFLYKGDNPLENTYLASFGPDWLDIPESAASALLIHRGNRTVKEVICDQHITSGIGNYLACEAAFLAHIHPHTRWRSLHPTDIVRLIHAIQDVVVEAGRNEGHDHWRVFKRAGLECPNNKHHRISYVKDSGNQRGSYYCEVCQGEPKGLPKLREAQDEHV